MVIDYVVSVNDDQITRDHITAVEELPASVSLVEDKQDRAFAAVDGSRYRRGAFPELKVPFIHDRAA